ncbi:MAG TPA: nitrile hydratase subunit alpha [Chloroflexota bacterium]
MTQVPVHVDSHMKDFEAHLKAVEADFEYYRAKRLEPRVLYYIRRGSVPLYDLLKAVPGAEDGSPVARVENEVEPHDHVHDELEQRIRTLEDRLDEYVRSIAATTADPGTVDVVIDDTRKESGTYDAFFRIAKRTHEGSMEQRINQLNRELDEGMFVIDVLRRALMASGKLTQEQLELRRANGTFAGPWNGGRIVARAWVDPEFKEALLSEGRLALRDLDIPPGRSGSILGVAENTSAVHNIVVCTLCSCYPYDLLGEPPWWYKHEIYRERIVRDPRGTIRDMFDLNVPDDKEVRVYDSTSDVRWMVLPERPDGTEGWTEEQLAQLVTRESVIGAAPALQPGQPVA